jgi:hypothetical protein
VARFSACSDRIARRRSVACATSSSDHQPGVDHSLRSRMGSDPLQKCANK